MAVAKGYKLKFIKQPREANNMGVAKGYKNLFFIYKYAIIYLIGN